MTEAPKTNRAYVFDFGRVVFRWRPEVLLQTVIPHRAADAESTRHWVAQVFQSYGGDWGDFDRGVVAPADLARRIAARTGLTEAEVVAIVEHCPRELEPLPDTLAWMRRLHAQGMPMHFLSNMPEPFAAHFERTHDLMAMFASGVFSARVHLLKPEPEIYAHAAAVFERAPADLLFLDDHLPNIVAARAAGWNAIHFVDAAQAQDEAREMGW